MAGIALGNKDTRRALPVSTDPVYVAVRRRLALGYRRNQEAGSWVARLADGKGGKRKIALGLADDLEKANGRTILSFAQAQDAAIALLRSRREDEIVEMDQPGTVKRALEAYEADLKIRGGDVANATRAVLHLSDKQLSRRVAQLTTNELRKWRDALAGKMAPASVNRVCSGLKAALNLAADHDDRIVSRRAWEMGLATIPDAERSRNVILDESTVRAIVVAAHGVSPEFGMLIEVAAVTGSRVSQLAALEIRDLQDNRADPRLMVPTSKKGRGKKIDRRPVPIPAGLAVRLRALAAGRPADAPLLRKPSGEAWAKSDHSRLFVRAAKAAGQDPDTVTMYALRHSNIVRQLLAGVPIRIVATNHDTSVGMIERTYSRHIGDHADALARAALLDTEPPAAPSPPSPAIATADMAAPEPAGNVVQLRRDLTA